MSERDIEWVNCLVCDGDEGSWGDDDKWRNCPACDGTGGYHDFPDDEKTQEVTP